MAEWVCVRACAARCQLDFAELCVPSILPFSPPGPPRMQHPLPAGGALAAWGTLPAIPTPDEDSHGCEVLGRQGVGQVSAEWRADEPGQYGCPVWGTIGEAGKKPGGPSGPEPDLPVGCSPPAHSMKEAAPQGYS